MASDNNTIVGVFNDYSKAEQAARELVEQGIHRESVHVQSSNKTAVEGGRSVVIVNARDQQIDRAVALLNQYGAVDINDDPGDYTGSTYTDASRGTAAYPATHR